MYLNLIYPVLTVVSRAFTLLHCYSVNVNSPMRGVGTHEWGGFRFWLGSTMFLTSLREPGEVRGGVC